MNEKTAKAHKAEIVNEAEKKYHSK